MVNDDGKKISLLEFESNPNIGLFMFVNDKIAIIGKELDEDKKKEIEKVLNVPIYHLNVLGTELVGVFLNGNDDFIITPKLYNHEFEKLKKICKENNIDLFEIDQRLNTFGNNMAIGDEEIIITKGFNKKFREELSKRLKLKVIVLENEQFYSVGGICKYINSGYFISQEIREEEVSEFIDKIHGIGTVNSGSNLVSSGIVGNKFGLLIGSYSTTIEIQNISESCKYI